MRTKKILSLSFFLLVAVTIYAQLEFIENNGQWNNNIKYKLQLQDGALFLENNCITYNFLENIEHNHGAEENHKHNNDALSHTIRHGHAYQLKFINNNTPQFIPQNPSNDYNNYFVGNDMSKWASRVRKYKSIKYQNIYNNIDLLYYITDNGLKYDFIVKPGANAEDILMEYEGVNDIIIKNGDLIIRTSVNQIVEVKPYSYQIIDGDTVKVNCKYELKNKRLKFILDKRYNKSEDLIIDPSLIFSTYSGSVADNWGFTSTWDYADNVYSGSIAFDTGYPTSLGAYQYDFAGGTDPGTYSPYANGCDIGIIKYNHDGSQRLYATYLGGSAGQEMPHSLIVTENNDLIIMGTTGSADFPTTTNAFCKTFSGGNNILYDNVISFPHGVDIFVAKLSEDGSQLLSSTYIGGSKNDGLNYKNYYDQHSYIVQHGNDSLYYNYADGARGEVIVDKDNYVYVGTNTFSSNFPVGISAGYQTSSAGEQDGVVFKLSPDLSQLVWSSYLGGSKDDVVFGITLDNNNDIIVAGGTTSQNFPTTAGAYNQTYNGGSTDAFVAKLNNAGNQLLHSTYFGSNNYDNAYFVSCDKENNIAICGQTKASGSTLIKNAGYSIPNSGQFITKFNSTLSDIIWSTVFGTGNGRPNISITAFAVDICNRIYLSGWGREWVGIPYNSQWEVYASSWDNVFGTKGMQVTADAIRSVTDGQDFYIMVLDKDANNLEYATFFGEMFYGNCSNSGRDHVDGGTSRFDKKGNIIQSACASCGGCQNFPTSENAWSRKNECPFNCNDAVFKIKIVEQLMAYFDPVPVGCIPYNVQFVNRSEGENSYLWDFGDGNTSTLENPSHIFTSAGEYEVTLIANSPSSCNISDTMKRIIKVVEPNHLHLEDLQICKGGNIAIGTAQEYPDGTTFRWYGNNLNNIDIKNPVASPSSTSDYIMTATGICVDSVYQSVNVLDPQISITTSNDTTICNGGTANLLAMSADNVDLWEWSINNNFSNIISNNPNINVSPSESTTYFIRASENECNIFTTAQIKVNVHQFNYSLPSQAILCYGVSTDLSIINNNSSDVLSYSWQPLAFIESGENTNSPTLNITEPTTFTVTISNQMGCTAIEDIFVNIDRVTFQTPALVDNLCFGDCSGSAKINPNGIAPFSYLWNTDKDTQTIHDLCSGMYSVTVTDAHGCINQTQITITSPDKITATFSTIVNPQCDGVGYGLATINPSGGVAPYSYSWSHGDSNQATNSQCLIGINYVTVSDSNECEAIFSVDMPSPSDLISEIIVHNNVSCYDFCNGNITVTANYGTAPYQFNWSNGMTGDAISNLCAGQYTLTVIDKDNCVSHQNTLITQPNPLAGNIEPTSPILCYGTTGTITALATGGTSPYTYLWNTGTVTNSLQDITAGQYQITINDHNGCSLIIPFTLTQPDTIHVEYNIINTICDNVCNGEISVSVSGGTSPYYFLWFNGNQNRSITRLCAGMYDLTVTDNNACISQKSYLVRNLGYVPQVKADANPLEVYRGQYISLIATSPDAGSYSWDNRNILDNWRIPNPIAKPEIETLFTVTFTSENGCINTDTIRVKVKEGICSDPYIYVPTGFTPNDDGKNDYFRPYYPDSFITSIYFAVYDRWGTIMYESDRIDDKGWDGTYKGKKLASDVYVFLLRTKCVNGEDYEYKGNVTLLR